MTLSDHDRSVFARAVDAMRYGSPAEEDFARLVTLGLVTHSVRPQWTAKGRAAYDELYAERRAAYERGQRCRRYLVVSIGRRTVHTNYQAALADFTERCGRLKRVKMEYRRGGSMETVAFFRRGTTTWCGGWPERGDKDTRADVSRLSAKGTPGGGEGA